ncbi:MAG: hypothetical protein AB7T06_35905 [Kofleriaceae bacterium]
MRAPAPDVHAVPRSLRAGDRAHTRAMDPSEHAGALTALEEQIDGLEHPSDLLVLSTKIDDLGRQLALELQRLALEPARMAPLKPVLLRVPVVHTRALLRCAEKLDDLGSPRRAVRVLLEALRKAFDANMVEMVVDALVFTLDAFEQRAATARLRALLEPLPDASRREARVRHMGIVDELIALIEWAALDDELGYD